MKKLLLLLPLLLLLIFTGCNKQESFNVVDDSQFGLSLLQVVEEWELKCHYVTIPTYRWDFDISQYPVKYLDSYTTAEITAIFSENFVDNYRYEDSDKFFFALKIFVWNYTDNGWYYNVLRARNNSVVNRTHLTWAVFASQLKNGFTWTIPLKEEIDVANKEFVEWKQMVKINLSDYFDWETRIGAYLSSTKELKWWELADITIKLCK